MANNPITNSSHSHDTWDEDERDDLDDFIAEIAKDHPEFPAMVEAALQRRREARARGEDPNAEPEEDEANEADKTQEQPAAPHAQR